MLRWITASLAAVLITAGGLAHSQEAPATPPEGAPEQAAPEQAAPDQAPAEGTTPETPAEGEAAPEAGDTTPPAGEGTETPAGEGTEGTATAEGAEGAETAAPGTETAPVAPEAAPVAGEIAAETETTEEGEAETEIELEEPLPAVYHRQLMADVRPLPEGMGAIMVGAMTDPTLEPAVKIERDGRRVTDGRTAEKIFLEPGTYMVRAGRGNDRVRPSQTVEVVAGEVSFVEPTWGALVVDVVDDHGIPHRGSYDLIRMDTRETVGSGRGADRRSGEGIRTWLLIPGVYKIVRPGGTYRERVDFTTVRIIGGEAIPYRLVMDPATGVFRGGGIAAGFEPTTINGVELRGSLGGSLQMTHRDNVAGAEDGVTLGGDIFADFDLMYDRGLHYVWTQLQLEAGMQLFPGENNEWRKTLDFLDMGAIYVLQLHEAIGPYINLTFNTHMIPGYAYYENPTEVVVRNTDGNEVSRTTDRERFLLGPEFSRLDLRQGVGANWRAVRSHYLDLDVRLGVGFQQLFTRDLHRLEVSADEGQVDPTVDPTVPPTTLPSDLRVYQQVEPFTHREGIAFNLVAAGSLTGWLSYDVEFGLLEPFNDMENPVLDFDLTLTLRLFSVASLNYILRIRRDVETLPSDANAEIDQTLLLRFAFNLF
jgi:hypothetical protein